MRRAGMRRGDRVRYQPDPELPGTQALIVGFDTGRVEVAYNDTGTLETDSGTYRYRYKWTRLTWAYPYELTLIRPTR